MLRPEHLHHNGSSPHESILTDKLGAPGRIEVKLAELRSLLEETGPDGAVTLMPEPGKNSDERAASKRAVEELQLYVDFVDSYIIPLWKQFDEGSDKTPRSISYDDIPLLFRAGELAYLRPPADIRNNPNSGIQTVFKMVSSMRDNCLGSGNIIWSIYCLDYQEGKYTPIRRKIRFPHFDGLVSITELPCYPLKFHLDWKNLLIQQTRGGQTFKKCIEVGIRDIYYTGWTLVTGMLPRSYSPSNIPEPEHIESEVIIDFKEALRQLPSALVETGDEPLEEELEEPMAYFLPQYRLWRDSGSPDYCETREFFVSRADGIHRKIWKEVEQHDKFLTSSEDISGADFTDKHLAILPKRLPGYVLRERKFALLHVLNFEIHREAEKVNLDAVQMPSEHRRIVRCAVAAHFQKRQRERTQRTTIRGVDLIRGKGNGLVILLHGPPGTGKTLTAEAVALENSKPLFPITCGDLGFTPDKVEQSLKDIFRYAHLWDCILLLDEADVFLTRRNVTDVQRNALVSVFLRVLEYYSGILFLTTNRVGAIDEAFRSRIHITLHYKYLNCEDTIAILDTHLKRLPSHNSNGSDASDGIVSGGEEGTGMIVMNKQIRNYISEEWQNYAKKHNRDRGPWNGRQIRNAVHIAACLAIYENQLRSSTNNSRGNGDGGDGGQARVSKEPVVLTADHFQTVALTTNEFDDYMKRVRRADADTMARMAGERDDFHDEEAYQMARFEGFSGPAVYHDQQHLYQRYRSAGDVGVGSQRGAHSRRGGPSRGPQRNNYGGADWDASQQRFPQGPREEYAEDTYVPTQRAGRQTRFQRQEMTPRGMRSSQVAATQSHDDDGGEEGELGAGGGNGDDYRYEDEQWQEDDGAYRPRGLHRRAVHQNRGYP
ncbi:hypothetical protein HDV57DRAFT_510631 [Trichoderma longibrachiatum]